MGWMSKSNDDSDEEKSNKSFVSAKNSEDVENQGSSTETKTNRRSAKPPVVRRPLDPQERRVRCILISSAIFTVLLTSVVLLSISFRKLDTTEYGVKYTRYSKILDDAAESSGLHAGPPAFKFIKFPSTYITVDQGGTCVSRDGLRVYFDVTFQYLIKQKDLTPVILKYRNFETWAKTVEAAGYSAVQHSCSEYNISNFQTQRGAIQNTMEENLKLKLGGDPNDDEDFGVYSEAISLQLRNVDLPEEYQTAVAEKQSAEEDIELAKNQRKQETTKANTNLLTAQEESQRILDNARNEADVVITEARLKAEETTFSFDKEAQTLEAVKRQLNLTTEGVLAYVTNKMLEDVGTLRVTAGEPAEMSRKQEL